HRYRLLDPSVREQLDLPVLAAHEPRLGERLRRDLAAHFVKVVEADDFRLLTKWICEAALGQTPRNRHLSALERRLAAARTMVSRARLDALMTLARRLALA